MGKSFFTDKDKQYIKDNLEKILLYYGAIPPKTQKGNWTCLKSRHKTPENSLTVKENICCCSCGIKGDSFSIIRNMDGLDDFYEVVEKGLNILGCDLSTRDRSQPEHKQTKVEIKKKQYDIDLTNIISEYYKNMQEWQYKYFYKRGIYNTKLFNKYKILIENPVKIFPKEILPDSKRLYMYRNIIPVWEGDKIKNCILRKDDKFSNTGLKVLNLKDIPLKIFNINYLYKVKENDFLFITEGIFDCLSFENFGYKAISINSVGMINRFIDKVIYNKTHLMENKIKFIISFDNDKAGIEGSNKLDEMLRKLGLTSYCFKLRNYKDINEFYIKNFNTFRTSIKEKLDCINK